MIAGFNKNRYRNFLIGVSISCGLTLFAFNYTTPYNIGDIVEILPPEEGGIKIIAMSMPPPPTPETRKPRTQKTEPFKIEAKIQIVTHTISPQKIDPPSPIPIVVPTIPLGGYALPSTTTYTWVEEKPEFPGGEDALNEFLKTNLVYPGDCLREDEQGIVKVMFIVDEHGNITDIKVIGNELFQSAAVESIRVIGMMPKWKPGKMNGEFVKTYFIQPIRFRLY